MATGKDREDRLLRRNLNSAEEEVSRQLEELRRTQQLLASRERQIEEYESTRQAQSSFSRDLMDDSIVVKARQAQKGTKEDDREVEHLPPKTPKQTTGNITSIENDYILDGEQYRTIDNLEQSTHSHADISDSIRKVDEKLSILRERRRQPFEQNIRQSDMDDKGYSTSYKEFLEQEMLRKERARTQEERDTQKLEDKYPTKSLDKSRVIPDKEGLVTRHIPPYKYSTPDLKYQDRYFEKLEALELREKEVERWNFKLKQREEQMIQMEQQLRAKEEDINEAFRQRDNKLTQYEQHLEAMQTQMNRRLNEMEARFEERDKQLLKQQINLDTKNKDSHENKIVGPFNQDSVKDTISEESKEIERKINELEAQKEALEVQKATLRRNPAGNLDKADQKVMIDSLNIKLNLTSFSGKEPVPRNEASYEEFKIEFESVSYIYSEQVLRQALRKCLKDQARKTMWHLGSNASVKDIMKTLEDTFGTIASEDTLLSKFLLAEQKADESIIEWGLRLEEIMLQVCRKAKIDSHEQNARLENRFWRGLRNEELKQATRVQFESLIPYEELRNKVRAEEFEIQIQRERTGTRPKTSKLNQIEAEEQNSHKDDTIQNLVKQMETLAKNVEEMKRNQEQRSVDNNQEFQHQDGRNFQYRQRGRGYQRGYRRGQSRSTHNDRRETAENETKENNEKPKQSSN